MVLRSLCGIKAVFELSIFLWYQRYIIFLNAEITGVYHHAWLQLLSIDSQSVVKCSRDSCACYPGTGTSVLTSFSTIAAQLMSKMLRVTDARRGVAHLPPQHSQWRKIEHFMASLGYVYEFELNLYYIRPCPKKQWCGGRLER